MTAYAAGAADISFFTPPAPAPAARVCTSGAPRSTPGRLPMWWLGEAVNGASEGGAPLAAVPPPGAQLPAVQTLGRFRVLPSGRAAPAVEWHSKKARDLLKLLVARRGRSIPREALIDALWPGESPARCANRLSVALSTIRSVLDPARLHPASHFVSTGKHSVALTNIRVDVEEFLAAARHALMGQHPTEMVRTRAFRRAAALYTGDFLEQDQHNDWAVSLREEAKATYVELLRTLASTAAIARSYDNAAQYNLRILERDGYDEQAHLGLVAVLRGAGQHGEARRRYQVYLDRMDEIGISPMPFPGEAGLRPY
ncbi:AfsR/SARP family transcriptional regulator [Fodinicola acaciae]|uniref:AfsR/SARP family transcriptional regulator n=1 Tax=Fodinicola acaciae TaxID=2681555 RepID=UPI0013D774DB|nr:BTAD domain-containing putative transcriptional regulator [Fodinicola acaciae]